MKILNRPKRTTAELISLIHQRRMDWWPSAFQLKINRSAEHDWIAVVDTQAYDSSSRMASDFLNSLAQVVAEVRLRNAWDGE